MSGVAAAAADASSQDLLHMVQKYSLEALGVVFILFYILNIFWGRIANRSLADSWCRVYAGPQSVLARNFSVWGSTLPTDFEFPREELFWKDSPSAYKLYCSGRRYCSGTLITLDMQARQDLFMRLSYLLSSRPDQVQIEVFMNEGTVPPTVMVVGAAKPLNALRRDEAFPDIRKFTTVLNIKKDKLPNFPTETLSAMAEQPSVFYDLFSEPRVAQVFSKSGQYASALRYFRSLVVSSEPAGNRGSILFTFAMPTSENMEDLQPLMALVWVIVDLLGAYKVTPEMKKRADELRAKVAQEESKEDTAARREALLLKKMEKMEAERARAARAGPEALAKFEEQKRKAMQKKAMRQRVKLVS